MIVLDNFLPSPVRVRRQALASDFIDWEGPDGEVYKRVCITEVPGLRDELEKRLGPISVLGMGYRLNYGGELPNAAIHSDLGWGTHACVLYLSDGEGGTAFWKHKETGRDSIDPGDWELYDKIHGEWDDADKWEMQALAEMKFNRCIVYESKYFHSRWPFEAFGEDEKTGRLIAVCFFNMGAS